MGRRKIEFNKDSIVKTIAVKVKKAGGYVTLAKFCKLFAKLAGLSEYVNNPSQSPALKEFFDDVTSGENPHLKPVEFQRGKSKRFFVALPGVEAETIKASKRKYTPRGLKLKRAAGGRRKARKQGRRAKFKDNSAEVLNLIIELCSALKRKDWKRKNEIALAEKKIERVETRLEACERETQKLRENFSFSRDGANDANFAELHKKVVTLIRQIEQEDG